MILLAKLPKSFEFRSAKDLKRIGRNNDGGYLVSYSDIINSDLLIGLGISDDWSFEQEFSNIKKMTILAYDGSISTKKLIRQSKKFLKEFKLSLALRKYITYVKFKSFFEQKCNHFTRKYVGFDKSHTIPEGYITLDSILKNRIEENIFLKIDIEGDEYQLLETLVKYQKNISGVTIEFHNCDSQLPSIEKFINDFKLKIIHIHANNYADITDSCLPPVIEVTFSKYSQFSEKTELPHKLDMPNNKKIPDIKLIIEE